LFPDRSRFCDRRGVGVRPASGRDRRSSRRRTDRVVEAWLAGDVRGRLRPAHCEVLIERFWQCRSVAGVARRGVPTAWPKLRMQHDLRSLRLVPEEGWG